MKGFIKYSLAASLAAGAMAERHHQHLHAKKHAGSRIEKREPDAVTHYVVGPTETVYELAGKVIDAEEAREGLKEGEFIVIGETTPTFSPPPPPPKPTTSSAAPDMGAKFVESKKPETSTEAPTTTSEPPKPTTTSEAPPPPPKPTSSKPAPAPAPSAGGGGGGGLDAKFKSGTVKCSDFPSDYGAVPLDWLGFDGWSGIQMVPDFSSLSSTISSIITGIAGEGCRPGAMCSYACPAGYQKTQWPSAQGATKQSIGGLYCNKEGLLELTREEVDTLCEKGEGGLTIQNDLDDVVATCRTDYPGTEAMVIPILAQPGSSMAVCNPSQEKYYIWDGMKTSAQYYINKKGYGLSDACVWNSAKDPEGAGNWSPMILGAGKAADGNTYISIFRNLPSSHAELDFNIEITGDVNSKCSFINGKFTGGSDGCTTAMRSGGKAVIRYF